MSPWFEQLFCPQKPRGDSGQTLFLSFTDLESELVMFNPPHLLKNIRDNLLKTLLLHCRWCCVMDVIKWLCKGPVISSQNGAQAVKEAYRDPSLFKTSCQLDSASPEPQRCHRHSLSVSDRRLLPPA